MSTLKKSKKTKPHANGIVRKKALTVENLMERQEELINFFSKKDQGLINEIVNIEYRLALVEQGYSLADTER